MPFCLITDISESDSTSRDFFINFQRDCQACAAFY